MIIFINGPFGVGKTTTAGLLVPSLKRGFLFDPEIIGTFLQRVIGPFYKVDDFQEYALWPVLTVLVARILVVCFRRSLVIPMTVFNIDRWRYIRGGLQSVDREFISVKLVCSETALRERILSRANEGGPYRWCLTHLAEGIHIMQNEEFGESVQTESVPPDKVALKVLQLAGLS